MTQAPLIEPHTRIRFPAALTPPGDSAPQWLAGAGVQQATLFRINVYAFGLYVDRDAARAALADYAGLFTGVPDAFWRGSTGCGAKKLPPLPISSPALHLPTAQFLSGPLGAVHSPE